MPFRECPPMHSICAVHQGRKACNQFQPLTSSSIFFAAQIAITPRRRTCGSFSSRRKQQKFEAGGINKNGKFLPKLELHAWHVNFNFISRYFLRGHQGSMFNWHANWPLSSLSSRSASPSGAMQWQVFTVACLLSFPCRLACNSFQFLLPSLPPFLLSCRRPLPRNDLWRPQNEGRGR